VSKGGGWVSELGQSEIPWQLKLQGSLGVRYLAAYRDLLYIVNHVLPQVALFSFWKTKEAATKAETTLKITANTVHPSLTTQIVRTDHSHHNQRSQPGNSLRQ